MLGTLVLIRDTFTDKETMGKFYIDGKYICETIERPWKNNTPRESCIPEGKYPLHLRPSPMIKKTTHGDYEEGYEIANVPGREYIMIHVSNWAHQLLGCVSPGESRGVLDGENAVLNSRKAFDKLMSKLDERNDWELLITHISNKKLF